MTVLPVTKYVGDVLGVRVRVKNTGTLPINLPISVKIGKEQVGVWHGSDIYVDGLGDLVYAQLDPGEETEVVREMSVVWDERIGEVWDLWVTLQNPENEGEIFKESLNLGVIIVNQLPEGMGLRGEIPPGAYGDIHKAFSPVSGVIRASWWMRKSGVSSGACALHLIGSNGSRRASVIFDAEGRIKVDASNHFVTVMNYSPNTWYYIVYVQDASDRRFWIEIYDSSGQNLLAQAQDVGAGLGDFASVATFVSTGNPGDYVDFDEVILEDVGAEVIVLEEFFDQPDSLQGWEGHVQYFQLAEEAQRP